MMAFPRLLFPLSCQKAGINRIDCRLGTTCLTVRLHIAGCTFFDVNCKVEKVAKVWVFLSKGRDFEGR